MSSRGPNQDQQINRPRIAPDQVPGLVMRTVLLATQETSGPQYPHLLRAAGLSRFINAMPDGGWDPVATKTELERLYATVYEMLGEPITRLFMRNYGQRLATQLLENRELQEIIRRAAALPPEQRLEAFLKEFAPFSARGWTAIRITQDPQTWYLELEHCPYCAGIHGATSPLCQGATVLYATLTKAATGRTMQVTETTCVAAGAPHCKFAVTK
jgi:bacteriochlorophyll 4-vinyl reductase